MRHGRSSPNACHSGGGRPGPLLSAPSPPPLHPTMPSAQSAAERAVAALGCGYDVARDVRLGDCKAGPSGSRLVELGPGAHDLVVPGGAVVKSAPPAVGCDKGDRTRFSSDVLSFSQMAEHFNRHSSLSGKVPCGMFNAMFDFRGCWQKDASATKNLAFDGWFIILYSVELTRSQLALLDSVKQDVPSSWNPVALAEFIEKYGTHVITSVKMGGKDVICLKQFHDSPLSPNEMQTLLKKLADECFIENSHEGTISASNELQSRLKEHNGMGMKPIRPSMISHSKNNDIISIHVRRGGIHQNKSHYQWLPTISLAPDVISMTFIPITSLLNGVDGIGFLSHAVNLYLRHKPPVEELHQFLEFQLPRQWAPVFNDLPLGPRHKKQSFPSLQFSCLGSKLWVSTAQVSSASRPVTGMRLYLEGMRNDCLAIHLQHLCAVPANLRISGATSCDPHSDVQDGKGCAEPVRRSLCSHICTVPVQYTGARIDDSAFIVTKAWLEVKKIDLRNVLFLKLGFANVSTAKIRRSEWDGPSVLSLRSGFTLSNGLSSSSILPPFLPKAELNSAKFPVGPPVPTRSPKMLKYVDTIETTRGPEDQPGYWLVTGAQLCKENGKISVKAKYSLLTIAPSDEL